MALRGKLNPMCIPPCVAFGEEAGKSETIAVIGSYDLDSVCDETMRRFPFDVSYETEFRSTFRTRAITISMICLNSTDVTLH